MEKVIKRNRNSVLAVIGTIAGIVLFLLAFIGGNMTITESLGLSLGGFVVPLTMLFDNLRDK